MTCSSARKAICVRSRDGRLSSSSTSLCCAMHLRAHRLDFHATQRLDAPFVVEPDRFQALFLRTLPLGFLLLILILALALALRPLCLAPLLLQRHFLKSRHVRFFAFQRRASLAFQR